MESEKNIHILQPIAEIAIPAVVQADDGTTPPGREAAWLGRLRGFFLLTLISLVLLLTWRPGVFRLSLLFSLGLPPLAESLAWKPPPVHTSPPPQAKPAPSPAEWRLASNHSAAWLPTRAGAPAEARFRTASLPRPAWRRFSRNPWNWRADRTRQGRRAAADISSLPPQKSVLALRIGDIAEWPTPAMGGQASPERDFSTARSPLSPVSPNIREQNGAGVPPPPFSLPAPADRLAPTPYGDPRPGMELVQGVPAAPASPPPPTQVDWRDREIAGPIPDAYLTIYPKLKFVGLCVPGQGYIRKYNQIAVPADLTGSKLSARDGRAPYGRYYIADRHRDSDGPRLFLSWPSPEDARRIGLDPGRLAQVDNAWRQHLLPPQDTAAGGGVGLNGLRSWVEATEGGFALEAPHMEEIFTALPDGAWVFIQP